jgi:cellulose synthase operon protein YhjQ
MQPKDPIAAGRNTIFREGQNGVSMGSNRIGIDNAPPTRSSPINSQRTGIDDHSGTDTTPEDVAALYSWANLRGAKYRDYSASRREHRAQVRYRASKALLDREVKAQAEAEASAEAAEREAREAGARALSGANKEPQQSRFASLRAAEAATLKAATERVEAARRAEAAAHATVLALREERELVDAQASATQQARIYTESEALRKHLAGPQPHLHLGAASAPPEEAAAEPPTPQPLAPPEAEPSARIKAGGWQPLSEAISGPQEEWQLRPVGVDQTAEIEQARPAWLAIPQAADEPEPITEPETTEPPSSAAAAPDESPSEPITLDANADVPESLEAPLESQPSPTQSSESLPRWLALREVLERSSRDSAVALPLAPPEIRTPILGVFSIAGGVGATSLVAALGRALSAAGEKVMLIDATSQALLPFYFGGKELRPGLIRNWSPPEGTGEPVSISLHDAAQMNADDDAQQHLVQQIFSSGVGTERMLVDLSPPCTWLLRRLAVLRPAVIVPLIPSMDSVIRLESTERLFRELSRGHAELLLPYYVLNHFDPSQPLHLDVRTVVRRRLGDRLLRFTIHESPAVAEAVADGMTVLDYAPDAVVAQEYRDIAGWLKTVSGPRSADSVNTRWGEL